ncbi:polymorphic toxin type 43 domain-containing protein [Nocardia sp. NPDC101769]|uniref:polymorphic toxin type 43 domain-containing protein n=1 Tax=Nocardia sp. NPDC101769 TaxID=3364333 RepID=UPI0037FB95F9
MHYNLNRIYDPATGRFLTQDPLGLAPAPNPGAYPHNPTVWTDPLGLVPEGCNQNGDDKLTGSGPKPGVIEASDRVKSLAALNNYHPPHGMEFVFDPDNGWFAVGDVAKYARAMHGSPHEQLAISIGADPGRVVGGLFWNSAEKGMSTNEMSGHFWQNWTDDIRQQFLDTMRGYGFNVEHHAGM